MYVIGLCEDRAGYVGPQIPESKDFELRSSLFFGLEFCFVDISSRKKWFSV